MEFQRTITDTNAPKRLQGLTLYATVKAKDKLEFKIELPDDATPNEIGYVRLLVAELSDALQADDE